MEERYEDFDPNKPSDCCGAEIIKAPAWNTKAEIELDEPNYGKFRYICSKCLRHAREKLVGQA